MNDLIASRSFRNQAVPASIEEIHVLLDELLEDASFLPEMDRLTFATAVIEAASNIVRHSVPSSPAPVDLGVEIGVRARSLRAEISAYGAADPNMALHDQGMPGPEAESGRGLALIRALVSTVTFARQDGTSIWVLSREATPA